MLCPVCLNSFVSQERRVLEEELGWARLERQKVLWNLAIWNLAALARRRIPRRTMQERDEARNQARMLLADVQARNAQVTMLTGASCSGAARPDAFAFAAGRSQSQALAPAAAFTAAVQGQHAWTGAAGWGVASSSGFGHANLASSLDAYAVQPSSLHGLASSSQDHFDPDMFLVDIAESPQDVVLDTAAGSSQGQSSGAYRQMAEQMQRPLQWKGKSAQPAVIRGSAGHGHAP
jgi:hypothetical protein